MLSQKQMQHGFRQSYLLLRRKDNRKREEQAIKTRENLKKLNLIYICSL